MKHADIIIPRGASNNIALQFVTENLQNKLYQMGCLQKSVDMKKENKVVQFPLVDQSLFFENQYAANIRTYNFEEDEK